MRFLANENFPGATVAALEAAGHDIVWVRIAAPGTTDPEVLAWAIREQRILLTFDKDFGELAKGSALPRVCGIVLLRMPMPRPGDVGAVAELKHRATIGLAILHYRARPRPDASARTVAWKPAGRRRETLQMAAPVWQGGRENRLQPEGGRAHATRGNLLRCGRADLS